MQAWIDDHVKQCAYLAEEAGRGVSAFCRGIAMVAQPRALVECAKSTITMIPCVGVVTVYLWLVCYPLRWLWLIVTLRDALRVSSVTAVAMQRLVLSEVSGTVFHTVLASYDASLAASIDGMPIIHGFRQKAISLVQKVVVGTVVVVALLACLAFVGPLLIPAALAIVGVVASSWMIVLPALLVLSVILALAGWGYVCVAPFMWLASKIDPLVAAIAVTVALLGLLHGASLRSMLQTVMVFCIASRYLTQQLLANYSQRLQHQEWMVFVSRNRIRIGSFGIPIFLLVENVPEAAVLLLPVFHGAAAVLLADILGKGGKDCNEANT